MEGDSKGRFSNKGDDGYKIMSNMMRCNNRDKCKFMKYTHKEFVRSNDKQLRSDIELKFLSKFVLGRGSEVIGEWVLYYIVSDRFNMKYNRS